MSIVEIAGHFDKKYKMVLVSLGIFLLKQLITKLFETRNDEKLRKEKGKKEKYKHKK